jgi:hypothetical protein
MTHSKMIQITSETARLVAHQVGRVYTLKAKHFSVGNLLCGKLGMHRAKFSSIKPYTMPAKLLRETAEIGGPRWRVGWGGIT